jgi:hypothetical protein
MILKNILNKVQKLGGSGEIEKGRYGIDKLIARLGVYTIEYKESDDFFTALKDGTVYDPGSDYNPDGYIFCYKIKNLNLLI